MKEQYDIIIVGGGHAGVEASLAAARMGLSVLLVTFDKKMIGYLSCNPAIGGVGKGQLVKEIDALGGEMGKAADNAGIQFRILNSSKGPAVRSSRAQVDREKYSRYIMDTVKNQDGIKIIEDEVTGIVVKNGTVQGVELGRHGPADGKSVIIAAGTFLNGKIHVGHENFYAGRIEDGNSSRLLPRNLESMGFDTMRFKTGTCARLDGGTIDFEKLKAQHGDVPPVPFSFSTGPLDNIRQKPCYITYTNDKTHNIIKKNLDRSPLFTGEITGTGVRYCPSIEDKIMKFPHHKRHHVFLEPESMQANIYYPNGISTSLPEDVQEAFIHTIEGLENVRINRYGYGIEHDVINPLQLYPTLETKPVANLFLAGQINGTTGYEEAAAQGLLAGMNAALKIKGRRAFIPDRTSSYIGVMVDDLTTKGTREPYRMFTSRVEYRLLLREGNADIRLREAGYKAGLADAESRKKTRQKKGDVEKLIIELQSKKISLPGGNITLFDYLIKGASIRDVQLSGNYPLEVLKEAETEVKYHPYVKRMLSDMKESRSLEKTEIPAGIRYEKIPGLSLEIVEKLSEIKPLTLGQAARISGVTPAAVVILTVHIRNIKKASEGHETKGQNTM